MENNNQQSSIIERIFPWTQSNTPTIVSINTNVHEPITVPAKEKDPIPSPPLQEIVVEKTIEPIDKKVDVPQTPVKKPIVTNKNEDIQFVPDSETSLFQMWNVIESVGIKREFLDKVFRTDEAVLELYTIVEKRIHQQREQEMIKRLQAYVEKRSKQKAADPSKIHQVTQ